MANQLTSSIEDRQAKSFLLKYLLLIVIVFVPMALAIVYYSVFAESRYVSSAQVAVRQTDRNGGMSAASAGLALLFGTSNPTSREETLYLRQYITSNNMLSILQRDAEWDEHFTERWSDPIFWLSKDAPKEDKLRFYQKMVQVHFDTETGLLNIDVQAFEPEYADRLLKIILRESEAFVNKLSHNLVQEQLSFVEREVASASKNYEIKRNEVLEFQDANNLLDAQATAESRAATIGKMEAQLAAEQARLKGLLMSLSPTSLQVQLQRKRINAIDAQISSEKQSLIAKSGKTELNTIAAQFRELEIRAKIAESAYKISLGSLENTKIEINKKFRSLAVIVSPSVPDKAIYPDRLYNLTALLLGLLMLLGIAKFIIATIKDHRD